VKVWNGAGFGCIVGFVKVIFDQLDLVGNRLAVVKRINFDDFNYETQAAAAAPWIGKCCHGVVEAFFWMVSMLVVAKIFWMMITNCRVGTSNFMVTIPMMRIVWMRMKGMMGMRLLPKGGK
jgi:hypothetical protein